MVYNSCNGVKWCRRADESLLITMNHCSTTKNGEKDRPEPNYVPVSCEKGYFGIWCLAQAICFVFGDLSSIWSADPLLPHNKNHQMVPVSCDQPHWYLCHFGWLNPFLVPFPFPHVGWFDPHWKPGRPWMGKSKTNPPCAKPLNSLF